MWKLIDFKTKYVDNGCDVDMLELFLIKNSETEESKWIDEYEFKKFHSLGLLK
ncbi:hypothetical protein F6Y03_30945 [Bacillus megaterium]|jgi:hypothetical protein|nr:hypothetical protein [Priestia megaterium]